MELVAIILALIGVVAFLAYKKGKGAVEKEVLESEIKSNEHRKAIRNMSDSDLDDELSKYWD